MTVKMQRSLWDQNNRVLLYIIFRLLSHFRIDRFPVDAFDNGCKPLYAWCTFLYRLRFDKIFSLVEYWAYDISEYASK